MKSEPVSLNEIVRALRELGGAARATIIKDRVTINRGAMPPQYKRSHSYRETIARIIENHCPQSLNYRGTPHFERVKRGTYRLIDWQFSIPQAVDLNEPGPAARVEIKQSRILRDTAIAREVKKLHGFKCQLCGDAVKLYGGKLYAEAHHIQPLGSPHNGPDIKENIICVCPNHHAQLDFGAISLEAMNLRICLGHKIAKKYIDYHNEKVFGKVKGAT